MGTCHLEPLPSKAARTHAKISATMTEMRQRPGATPYTPYDADNAEEEDYKDHPPPVKQMGQGMLIGMAIAAILVIGFVVYIEEKGWQPDHELHAKVMAEHDKREASHKILSGILKDTHEKHERGELPVHKPTPEEEEANRLHHALMEDDHHEDEVEAEGMFDALGNQMHDNKFDLQHRLDSFWDMDKNKDAFLTEIDFEHLVRRPGNLNEADFKKLDQNNDGAVGVREWTHGFHDTSHMGEAWYHHKYGFVYGHDIPDHFSKAKIGAVKKGTAEHKAMKEGNHPAQIQRKIDDLKKDKEHKELNQKAHIEHEKEDERHEKEHAKEMAAAKARGEHHDEDEHH